MTSRAELFRSLEELYSSLPTTSGNPCGSCNACCRADLSHHRVSSLELELIAERVSPQASQRMRGYLERECDDQGELRFPVCPNYQEGCQIYPVRPFSCRTFGLLREQGTLLPEGCVFIGLETVFEGRDYFQSVPQSRQLRGLAREFQLFLRSPQTNYQATQTVGPAATAADFLELGDELDRALVLQAQGRLEEALEMALSAPQGNYRDYSLALLYSALDNHAQAAQHFGQLAERIPGRAEFHYYAGYHSLFLGRVEQALQALQRAVQVEPSYAMAWGFLGYLFFQQGRWQLAAEHFQQGRRADPSNPFFALRWADCQQRLGHSEGVPEALEQALQAPATAAEASALLREG